MYELKEWLRESLTDMCIGIILSLNKHRDERLSYALHHIADRYARKPTLEWEYE